MERTLVIPLAFKIILNANGIIAAITDFRPLQDIKVHFKAILNAISLALFTPPHLFSTNITSLHYSSLSRTGYMAVLSIHLAIYLSIHRFLSLSIYLSIYLFIHLLQSIYWSTPNHQSIHLSIYTQPSISLSIHPSIPNRPSLYLSIHLNTTIHLSNHLSIYRPSIDLHPSILLSIHVLTLFITEAFRI